MKVESGSRGQNTGERRAFVKDVFALRGKKRNAYRKT